MILELIFYALLATAHNHYYECFDHKTCESVYDDKKIYCYHGTCTDRCPPGYLQENIGQNRSFTCECDTKKGFESDGLFDGEFQSLSIHKCKCAKDFCVVTVYATGIGYTDGLVPYGAPPNCKILPDEIPDVLTEFAFFLIVITMTIFLCVNCRSASGVIYDLHRYYAIYILGSMAVIVFVSTVTPFSVGFTRTMAFGIMAHNSSEWNILLRLNFGKTAYVRNSTNVCLIIYYILLLILTAILPLSFLLYFAMIQGGFVDWILLLFIFAAGKSMKQEGNWEHVFKRCCKTVYSRFVFWYGFGAFFQLLAVEILFVGFILNHSALIGGGAFFLLPAFFCYTIWVYGEEHYMLFCGPSVFMNYNKNYKTQSLLIPFKHTTRVVDILWNKFMGGYKPIENADFEIQRIQNHKKSTNMDDIVMNYVEQDDGRTKFHVEDCESFMFGIQDHVSKCDCGPQCPSCAWIPLYWVAALLIVIVNVALLIFIPKQFPANSCNTGFDYGAW